MTISSKGSTSNGPLCFSRVSLRSGILDDGQRARKSMPLKKFQKKHKVRRKHSDIVARLRGLQDKKNKTVLDWAWIACLQWVLGHDNIEL